MTLVAETDQQRAERYLSMATHTSALAQRADDPAVAAAYMHMASIWLRMAQDLTSRLAANDERPVAANDGSEASADARA